MGTLSGSGGRVPVFLNPRAGGSDQTDTAARVVELFAARGIEAIVMPWRGDGAVADRVRDAARGATTVVAGGGDGTVSAVASALAGTPVRLGVLPIGTLNHFAKDAGIPLDLEGAVGVIAAGHVVAVDIGEVNGRTFINNCSLGVYPAIVRGREKLQRRGHGKWLSFLVAAMQTLRQPPRAHVTLDADGQRTACKTTFVMVGNNAYEVLGLNLGGRASLTGGRIVAYLGSSLTELQVVPAGHLRIDIAKLRSVQLAVDGEVSMTSLPIECRCRPAALHVLVPGN
jgi:diacylglycerol kinase family enzyme